MGPGASVGVTLLAAPTRGELMGPGAMVGVTLPAEPTGVGGIDTWDDKAAGNQSSVKSVKANGPREAKADVVSVLERGIASGSDNGLAGTPSPRFSSELVFCSGVFHNVS